MGDGPSCVACGRKSSDDSAGDSVSEQKHEIAVATADAQCRESSGWTHLLYEATWDQQVAFISAHQTDVDAYLAREEETAEKMRQIITEAGGTL